MKIYKLDNWTMILAENPKESQMLDESIKRIPLPDACLQIYDDQVPVPVVDLCRRRWEDVLERRSGIDRDSLGCLSPAASKGRDQLTWTLRSKDSAPPWPHRSQNPSGNRTQATPKGIVHKIRKMCAWFSLFRPNVKCGGTAAQDS